MRKPMYTVKPFGANDQPLTYFRQRSWSLVGNDELTAYRSLTTVWLGDLSMTKARKLSAAVVAGWAVTAAVTVGPVAAGAQGPTSVGGSVGTTNAFENGARASEQRRCQTAEPPIRAPSGQQLTPPPYVMPEDECASEQGRCPTAGRANCWPDVFERARRLIRSLDTGQRVR